MALPRPVLIALIGATVAGALFAYTRSMGAKNATAPKGSATGEAQSQKQPGGSSGTGSGGKAGSGAGAQASGGGSAGSGKSGSGQSGSGKSGASGGSAQAGGSTGAGASGGKGAGSAQGTPTMLSVPPDVARAMADRKVVVVLFWSKKGIDDRRVKKSLESVRERESGANLAVFYDSPRNVARYSLITGGSDVGQTPALVVVDRARRVAVANGFIDAVSIAEMIRDASKTKAG